MLNIQLSLKVQNKPCELQQLHTSYIVHPASLIFQCFFRLSAGKHFFPEVGITDTVGIA